MRLSHLLNELFLLALNHLDRLPDAGDPPGTVAPVSLVVAVPEAVLLVQLVSHCEDLETAHLELRLEVLICCLGLGDGLSLLLVFGSHVEKLNTYTPDPDVSTLQASNE